MASVHESVSDFVLFPRTQAYYDHLHSSVDEDLIGSDCNLRNPLAMQQPFQDRGLALFGDSSNSPAYPLGHLNYFNAPDLIVDGPKEQARQYPKRYTPSGSASPSVPQSLDHPPSSLSSASGASGQSTASSTVGSPYSLANHSLPSHDAWSELNQGLGIAPDIIHNEGFSQDAFSNGSLEGELCYQDGKFSDSFVGESGKFSSVSCCRNHSTSATSLVSGCNSTSLRSPFPQSPPTSVGPSMMSNDAPEGSLRPSPPSAVDEHLGKRQCSHQTRPVATNTSGEYALHSLVTSDMESPSSRTFKPPVKPASAMVLSRRQSSPSCQYPAHRNRTEDYQPQNLFFNQSNGRFIAPLESSCRFSF